MLDQISGEMVPLDALSSLHSSEEIKKVQVHDFQLLCSYTYMYVCRHQDLEHWICARSMCGASAELCTAHSARRRKKKRGSHKPRRTYDNI